MRSSTIGVALLICSAQYSSAQSVNSPYSTYVIGDLEHRNYDKTSGMANSGTALMSSGFHLLNKNPASMAGLERSYVLGNATFVARSISFAGDPITIDNNKGKDFFIKNFSIATKLNKFWSAGVSLMPFSYVNYAYRTKLSIEGSDKRYDALYEGDGGIFNININNAFNVGKHLALGLRTSILSGSVNQDEILQTPLADDPIETKRKDYYSKIRFEYGAILFGKLSKNWKYSLGGKFAAGTALNRERSLLIRQGKTIIREDKVYARDEINLPMTFDAGFAFIYKNQVTYSADYSFQGWGTDPMKGRNWSTVNSHRFAAGIQVSNMMERWNVQWEKSYIQAGGFFNKSYLQVNNTAVDEFGVSIGYGGYLSGKMSYGLALEVGKRGTTVKNLVRENYIQLSFRFSFREFMYSKGRKYD